MKLRELVKLGHINIIEGPVAVSVGKRWIGIASGNRRAAKLRRTQEQAFEDAKKMEKE